MKALLSFSLRLAFSFYFVVSSSFAEEPGNAELYQEFHSIEGSRESLNAGELQTVYNATCANAVAAITDANMAKYDPDGVYGFCFLRGMTGVAYAHKLGLDPSHNRKLFYIGDLREDSSKPEWRFHTTPLEDRDNGEHWTTDAIMTGPLSGKEWISNVRSTWDNWQPTKGYIYVVDSSAVLPDLTHYPESSDQETGDGIIELKFHPEKHGIPKDEALSREFGVDVYVLDKALTQKYFLSVTQDPTKGFDFRQITINGKVMSFNGAFIDLLKTLDPSVAAAHISQARAKALVVGSKPRSTPLGFNPWRLRP